MTRSTPSLFVPLEASTLPGSPLPDSSGKASAIIPPRPASGNSPGHLDWLPEPALTMACCWCVGIVLADYGRPPCLLCCVLGGGLLAAWGLYRAQRLMSHVLLWAAAMLASAAWYQFRSDQVAANDLVTWAEGTRQPSLIRGTVRGPVRVGQARSASGSRDLQPRTSFRLLASHYRTHAWQTTSGEVHVIVTGQLDAREGDVYQLGGQLSRSATPRNPGERIRWQDASWVLAVDSLENAQRLQPARGWLAVRATLRRTLERCRTRMLARLRRHLPADVADVVGTLVLGARDSLAPSQKEAYLLSGTIHLLAISGMHVGIVASCLGFVIIPLPLPRRVALALVGGCLIFYSLLSGAQTPVLRATVLALLLSGSRVSGRFASPLQLLSVTAIALLVWSPTQLFQPGFQLSFVAVAVIVARGRGHSPRAPSPLSQLLAASRPRWWNGLLRVCGTCLELVRLSLQIWLITLPIIVHHFQLVTWVGVLLSPLLWLPVAVALICGLGIGLTGDWLPLVADALAVPCAASVQVMNGLVGRALASPWTFVWYTSGPPWYWMCLFYGGCVAFLLRLLTRHQLRGVLALCLVLWSVGQPMARSLLRTGWPRLRCTVVAVGHGTSVILELPEGEVMVYDAGSLGHGGRAAEQIAGCLKSLGHHHIDHLILSHADADHYNAVPSLLQRVGIREISVTPCMYHSASTSLGELWEEARNRAIPVQRVGTGSRIGPPASACQLRILHPSQAFSEGPSLGASDNERSLVLSVRFRGRHLLFPGDLEGAGMQQLLQTPAQDADVVMAPHHGSLHQDPSPFFRWCTPQWVVVSSRQAPDPNYPRGPHRLLSTWEHGAIQFEITAGSELRVKTWRPASGVSRGRSRGWHSWRRRSDE